MYYISKRFNGYPFAHRQWRHDGHCALIHGHNWNFIIHMRAADLDENGFVYDFGKFKDTKEWFKEMFDHTCVLNEDDPLLDNFQIMDEQGLIDLKIVESCSCEGLAKTVYDWVAQDIKKRTNGRVQLVSVTVEEDEKNSAQYDGMKS